MTWRARNIRATGTKLVLLAVFSLVSACGLETGGPAEAPDTPRQRDAVEIATSSVEESEIREHLSHLTGVSPAPLAGGETVEIPERGREEGRRAAAEYMKDSFEAAGAEARIIEFDSKAGRGFNVEATVRGTGDRHLWLTAHMDSVDNAGANDNASGLTSLLEVAEAVAEVRPEHTVHFVAYDLEEKGLIGSSRYVESTVKDLRDREGEGAIIGNINSDMIGYEKDAFDAVIGTCDQAGTLDDAFRRAAQEIDSPIELEEKCLGRSDHEHFWEAGLPALVLTDGSVYDNYPHYHAPSDTAEKLNVRYLQATIQLTTAATIRLANP